MLTQGQFLKMIFTHVPTGFIELYYMIPQGRKAPYGSAWQYGQYAPLPLNRIIPDEIPSAMNANKQGYGVYFGVTPSDTAFTREEKRRRRETNVHYVTTLWADLDNTTYENAARRFDDWKHQPSIVVKSGGGIHAYWLLNEPFAVNEDNRSLIKRMLQGIAKAHQQQGGDTKVKDLARVLRLPGTANTKPERQNARCEVESFTGELHSITDLHRQFRLYMPTEVLQIQREITPIKTDGLPKLVQNFIDSPPASGERNTRLYSAARACLDAGLSQSDCERLIGSKASVTGLEQYEIERTIASAYHAAPQVSTHNDYRLQRIAMRDKQIRVGGWK